MKMAVDLSRQSRTAPWTRTGTRLSRWTSATWPRLQAHDLRLRNPRAWVRGGKWVNGSSVSRGCSRADPGVRQRRA
jgi:hypothetical protein